MPGNLGEPHRASPPGFACKVLRGDGLANKLLCTYQRRPAAQAGSVMCSVLQWVAGRCTGTGGPLQVPYLLVRLVVVNRGSGIEMGHVNGARIGPFQFCPVHNVRSTVLALLGLHMRSCNVTCGSTSLSGRSVDWSHALRRGIFSRGVLVGG